MEKPWWVKRGIEHSNKGTHNARALINPHDTEPPLSTLGSSYPHSSNYNDRDVSGASRLQNSGVSGVVAADKYAGIEAIVDGADNIRGSPNNGYGSRGFGSLDGSRGNDVGSERGSEAEVVVDGNPRGPVGGLFSLIPKQLKYAVVGAGLAALVALGTLPGVACSVPPTPTPLPTATATPAPDELEVYVARIVAQYPQHRIVRGSVDTMRGKGEIVIRYDPKKTDQETARCNLELYRDMIPRLERYENLPFFKYPVLIYPVFIDNEQPLNASGAINTYSNKSVFTHAAEFAKEHVLGEFWLHEGGSIFIGLKVLGEIAAEDTNECFKRFNERGTSFTANATEQYYNTVMRNKLGIFWVDRSGKLYTGRGNVPVPPEAVSLTKIPMEKLFEYKLGGETAYQLGFAFFVDLEHLVGEEPVRRGFGELARADSRTQTDGAYATFRKYMPSNMLPEFDKFWEKRAFGDPERLNEVKKQLGIGQ